MALLLLAVPFGPHLAWKRGDLPGVSQRLYAAAGVAVVAGLMPAALQVRGPWLAPFGIALGAFVMAGAVSEWAFRVKLFQAGGAEVWRRARNLPRSAYGGEIAHFGLGLLVVGIVATSAWRSEHVLAMKPGATTAIAGYELAFRGVVPRRGPNYQEQVGLFTVSRGGVATAELTPSKRLYDAPRQTTTEAGILVAMAGDLYAVLGDEHADGAYTVRLYFNPLVRLIWLGALVMFLGGALSLSDRRLRVGAPRRARTAVVVPAE
jgi:cytochrome c-type biogenesis protein CcmF